MLLCFFSPLFLGLVLSPLEAAEVDPRWHGMFCFFCVWPSFTHLCPESPAGRYQLGRERRAILPLSIRSKHLGNADTDTSRHTSRPSVMRIWHRYFWGQSSQNERVSRDERKRTDREGRLNQQSNTSLSSYFCLFSLSRSLSASLWRPTLSFLGHPK